MCLIVILRLHQSGPWNGIHGNSDDEWVVGGVMETAYLYS